MSGDGDSGNSTKRSRSVTSFTAMPIMPMAQKIGFPQGFGQAEYDSQIYITPTVDQYRISYKSSRGPVVFVYDPELQAYFPRLNDRELPVDPQIPAAYLIAGLGVLIPYRVQGKLGFKLVETYPLHATQTALLARPRSAKPLPKKPIQTGDVTNEISVDATWFTGAIPEGDKGPISYGDLQFIWKDNAYYCVNESGETIDLTLPKQPGKHPAFVVQGMGALIPQPRTEGGQTFTVYALVPEIWFIEHLPRSWDIAKPERRTVSAPTFTPSLSSLPPGVSLSQILRTMQAHEGGGDKPKPNA